MTRDEFHALYQQGEEATYLLFQQILTRLSALEEQAKKNSQNSSKPPSSDGLSKPPLKPMPQSLRKKSGKKPGAQKGHPGKTLLLVAVPDAIVVHPPATCAHCQTSLQNAPESGYRRRQVFEMPFPRVLVTEHRAVVVACPCCQRETAAAFPEMVKQAVQYGPNLLGFAAYLHTVHLLPYARCAQIVQEVTGAPFSVGSLHQALTGAGNRLAAFDERLQAALLASSLLHADETGMRVSGRLAWVHVRTTARLCRLFCHEKRGKEATDDLLSYSGLLVSDFFSNYVTLPCSHQFCGAHLLRELTYADEVLGQCWAGRLQKVVERMVAACHRARGRGSPAVWNARALAREFDDWVREGLRQNPMPAPKPGKKRVAKGKVRCLLERLVAYRDAYLGFLFDLSVPFSNNRAERDVRMVKVKGKVSGCFRTGAGATLFCRLRSYVVSCQKQGMAVLSCLRSLFAGNPILPDLSPA